MAKITINIDDNLLERLEKHLERSGQTKTFAIGQAIENWLKDEEYRFADEEPKNVDRHGLGRIKR